jgi:hypothetical protein
MKELGGCKCWDWKSQHIEAKLVKLGLVEPVVDEKTGTRRRKSKLARRRSAVTGIPPSTPRTVQGQHPTVMNEWTGPNNATNATGQGLHPTLAMPRRQGSYDATALGSIEESASRDVDMSEEQTTRLFEDLFPENADAVMFENDDYEKTSTMSTHSTGSVWER